MSSSKTNHVQKFQNWDFCKNYNLRLISLITPSILVLIKCRHILKLLCGKKKLKTSKKYLKTVKLEKKKRLWGPVKTMPGRFTHLCMKEKHAWGGRAQRRPAAIKCFVSLRWNRTMKQLISETEQETLQMKPFNKTRETEIN